MTGASYNGGRDLSRLRTGSWAEGAACAHSDPELFHAPEFLVGSGGRRNPDNAAAVVICRPCPVRGECLRFALSLSALDDWGVWGGATERERQAWRKGAVA